MRKQYTESQLREIFRQVGGPGIDLFFPASAIGQPEKNGPTLSVYTRYSEVATEKGSLELLWDDLCQLSLLQIVQSFSIMNQILFKETMNPAIHSIIQKRYIRPELNKKPRGEFAQPPDGNYIFHRAQILASIRCGFSVSSDVPGWPATDRFLIGDVALLTNEFLGYPKSDTIGDYSAVLMDLFPWYELYNHRDPSNSLPRINLIVNNYLHSHDAKVKSYIEQLKLDLNAPVIEGLTLEEYSAIVLSIFAYGITTEPKKLLASEAATVFDTDEYWAKTAVPKEKVEIFLDQKGKSFEWFENRFANEPKLDRKQFCENAQQLLSPNFVDFKQNPIIRLTDKRFTVLDYQFLIELLIYGIFWNLFDSVKDKQNFVALWGRVFELYLQDQFNFHYPPASGILRYEVPFSDGEIDFLLNFGSYIVVIESKGNLLSSNAKYSGNKELLFKELVDKFVDPKGVVQLAKACRAIAKGEIPEVQPSARIYPVLLVYEASLEGPFINRFLNDRFKLIRPDDANVAPLTVMSVDELEDFLPLLREGILTWEQAINSRTNREDVVEYSFAVTLHQLSRNVQKEIRNELLSAEYETLFKSIVRTMGL